jgi:hypothetical protein
VIGGALALVILPRLLQPALVMLAHRKHDAIQGYAEGV